MGQVSVELRSSAAPYLSVLAVGVIAGQYANYLWYELPVFKGQATNILVTFAFFGLALLAWLCVERRPPASGWLLLFLVAIAVAWGVHLALYLAHGDAFNYTAWLYVPILIMMGLKPPRATEAWASVLAFAWATAVVLLLTRVMEMVGFLAIKSQPQGIIDFDTERYFLPLNDLMGIDGRWPGPFGHNGDTAMMGALLIVIAFAHWTRASWVFIPIGVVTLLLTSGRASMGAAAGGLIVMAMLATQGPLGRIRRSIRIPVGLVLLAFGALFMFTWKAGVTGRDTIWPAFLKLWESSPWVGVGGYGIANGDEVTSLFLHAHSLYIDELARFGLAGFVSQFGALGIGLGLAIWAAVQGRPGPLGVLTAYFITGITEPRNFWIAPSVTGFLVILMVVTAAGELARLRSSTQESDQQAKGLASGTASEITGGRGIANDA